MSPGAIQLFLDEDVDVLLAGLMKSRGWGTETVHGAKREGFADESQLEYAAAHGMAIVTHNRDDFLELAEAWRTSGREHSGIIIAVRRFSTRELADRLVVLLARMPAEDMAGQVYYL